MCFFEATAEHKPLPKRVSKDLPSHSTTPKPSLAMQLSFPKQKEEKNSVGWGSFRSEKQKTEFFPLLLIVATLASWAAASTSSGVGVGAVALSSMASCMINDGVVL